MDPKTLTSLEQIGDKFDPASGYANYRKLSFEPPCLHLYAVPLRTLTLIEEGNPHFLKDDPDLICFSRLTMIAECIDMLHLQAPEYTKYHFEADPEVMEWLQQVCVDWVKVPRRSESTHMMMVRVDAPIDRGTTV